MASDISGEIVETEGARAMGSTMIRGFAVSLLLAAVAGAAPARAAALVIDGEEIADAQLYEAARQEGTVTLYGVRPERNFTPLKEAFEKDTGIKVDFLRFTTQLLFQRATAEFAAGRLAADYIDLTDPPLIRELVKQGILDHPHKVPGFDRLPPTVRDDAGRWYDLFRSPAAIGFNSAIVTPAERPSRWADLLQPRWKGKIGLASLDVGGSAFTIFAYMRDQLTPGFWRALAANAPRIYPAVSPTVADLSRGETSLVVTSASIFIEQMEEGAPLDLVFPVEGVPVFPVTGGITSAARHPNAAALFLNWLASRHGGIEVIKQGSYAINPDVPPPSLHGIQFPPLSQLWSLPLDRWESIRVGYSAEWRAVFQNR
jgi:iron(III) transport system substrate-binding protein